MDWFGFEADFFRIKGKGESTIGNYFDWTRFGLSDALPLYQVDFNDSSFNTLIHIDESAGYPTVLYAFTGYETVSLTVQAEGFLANQTNDGSGYQIQSNGGIDDQYLG